MLTRLVLAALAALVIAAPAQAATFHVEGTVLVYTGAGNEDNSVSGFQSVSDGFVFSTGDVNSGVDPVMTSRGDSGCVDRFIDPTPTDFNCPTINSSGQPITRIEIRGNENVDHLSTGWNVPVTLLGGNGDDVLTGLNQADLLLGDAGADWLRGGNGADDLQGGTGPDRLEGGGGADTIRGGQGVDVANYGPFGPSVTVTIDGVADDGEPGENDNVLTDVEDLWGRPGADNLTGSAGANEIRGGGGADVISGGGGRDELSGQDGNDTILARDGVGEAVECGAGADTAEVDDLDSADPSECETLSSSNALQPDLDQDGVDRPADCDDGDPGRRPGLFDQPENGLDEDCSGGDAAQLDRDGDAFPVPRDCDDANPAIHPGAREQPGNGADENCDGRAQPFPRVGVTVGDAWSVRGGVARVARLVLDGVRAGTKVRLRCKGDGCPFARKSVPTPKGKRTLALQRRLRALRLRRGSVLELWITRPQAIGSVVRFTGRRGLPARKDLCVPPGANAPARCA